MSSFEQFIQEPIYPQNVSPGRGIGIAKPSGSTSQHEMSSLFFSALARRIGIHVPISRRPPNRDHANLEPVKLQLPGIGLFVPIEDADDIGLMQIEIVQDNCFPMIEVDLFRIPDRHIDATVLRVWCEGGENSGADRPVRCDTFLAVGMWEHKDRCQHKKQHSHVSNRSEHGPESIQHIYTLSKATDE